MVKDLTQSQAAALVGVTARRLRQLDQDPFPPPKNSNGQYDPHLFGKWLTARNRSSLATMPDGQVLDLNDERARLTYHQANIAALDEQVKAKALIPADVVLDTWQDIAANIRTRLLAIPSQLAATCEHASRDDIKEKASSLIRQSLEELADAEY